MTTQALETRTCDWCGYSETTIPGQSDVQDFDLRLPDWRWEAWDAIQEQGIRLRGLWQHWGRRCSACRGKLHNEVRLCRCDQTKGKSSGTP